MDTAELSFSVGEAVGVGFIIVILIKFSIDYIKKLFIYIGRKYNKWQNISDELWTTIWMIVALMLGIGFAIILRVNAEETINAIMPGVTLPVKGIWAQVATGVILARSSNILNDLKKPFASLVNRGNKAPVPDSPPSSEPEKESDMTNSDGPVSPFEFEKSEKPKMNSEITDLYSEYKKQRELDGFVKDDIKVGKTEIDSNIVEAPKVLDEPEIRDGVLLVEWSSSLQDKTRYYQPVEPQYIYIDGKVHKL